jgi:hypothetical protein
MRVPAALTLRGADSLWAANYAHHDTTRALALMADDFFMTTSSGCVKDRAAELGDVRPQRDLTMQYFRTDDVRTREYANGSAGVVTGTAAWAFAQGGRTTQVQRRYTALYVRGGPLGWQLVTLHMGAAPPPPPPPADRP